MKSLASKGRINSRANEARLEGQRLEVEVTFASPASISQAAAPFDVFIFRAGDLGHQIHFPQYAGSAAMNAELFGSGQDASTSTRRFVHQSGIPAALNLMTTTRYPLEGVTISALFPDIVTFAASSGASATSFYSTNVVGVNGHDVAEVAPPAIGSPSAACVPGSLTIVSGDGQVLARARTSEPLRVRLLSVGSTPLAGRSVTYDILMGSGSLGNDLFASSLTATTDEAGYAQLVYTAGADLGAAFVRADDGAGHAQIFALSVVDYSPTGVAIAATDAAGYATALAVVRQDALIPAFPGAQAPATPQLSPFTTVSSVSGPTVAAAPVAGTPLGYSLSPSATRRVDNVATGSQQVTLSVSAALAPGTTAAAVAPAAAAIDAVRALSFPTITAAAPASSASLARSALTAGLASVTVAPIDAVVGPLDRGVATAAVTAYTLRQVTNLAGENVTNSGGPLVAADADTIYFAGYNVHLMQKLYRYAVSTRVLTQVADLRGPTVSDAISGIYPAGSDVYFAATGGDGLKKLFRYDGASVTRAADVNPGADDVISDVPVPLAGGLVFVAGITSGTGTSSKVFYTQGGVATQVSNTIGNNAQTDNPQSLVAYGGKAYFWAYNASTSIKYFAFDPSRTPLGAASTTQVFNQRLATQSDGGFTARGLVSGGKLYLAVNNAAGFNKLHAWDGTTLTQVASPGASTQSDLPVPFATVNGRVLFQAQNTSFRNKVWALNTSTGVLTGFEVSGSASLNDNLQPGSYGPGGYANVATSASAAYFVVQNTNGTVRNKVFRSDGATIAQVADLRPGLDDAPSGLAVLGQSLYFSAVNTGLASKLYRYDGVAVTQAADTNPTGSDTDLTPVVVPVAASGALVYIARDATNFFRLHRLDGTIATRLPDPTAITVAVNRAGDAIVSPVVYQGAIYFGGVGPTSGVRKLWRLDGAGATQVASIRGASVTDAVTSITPCGGRLYFGAATSPSGYTKLFAYDGSAVRQVSDTRANQSDSPTNLVCYQGALYFSSANGSGFTKLYRADATSVTQVSDLRGAAGSDAPTAPVVWTSADGSTSHLFLRMSSPTNTTKLYRFDGSSLTQVSNVVAGNDLPTPLLATPPGAGANSGLLFLTMSNAAGFTKLYKYDGSSFTQLSNLSSGSNDTITNAALFGGVLYFSGTVSGLTKLFAYDGSTLKQVSAFGVSLFSDAPGQGVAYAAKLWLSMTRGGAAKLYAFDGSGFTQMSDTAGAGSSDAPTGLFVHDNALYFQANVLNSALQTSFTKLVRLCDPSAGCTP